MLTRVLNSKTTIRVTSAPRLNKEFELDKDKFFEIKIPAGCTVQQFIDYAITTSVLRKFKSLFYEEALCLELIRWLFYWYPNEIGIEQIMFNADNPINPDSPIDTIKSNACLSIDLFKVESFEPISTIKVTRARYKRELLKTFECFLIYQLISLLSTSIIGFTINTILLVQSQRAALHFLLQSLF